MTKPTKPVMVQRKAEPVWGPTDADTLKALSKIVDELIERYGEEASITFDAGYNSIDFCVYYHTPETDEEREYRLKKEDEKAGLIAKALAKSKDEELALYEKLRAKYG